MKYLIFAGYQFTRASITKLFTECLINNRNLFLTVLMAGKPKLRPQQIQSGEVLFLMEGNFLLCPHVVEEESISLGFLYKGINPKHESSVFMA